MRPRNIKLTRNIPNPHAYVRALDGEYRDWAYNEERCLSFKGKWRTLFGATKNVPMDLEVGTGNGMFFAHRARSQPQRLLVGAELKYKPLIQSIRRTTQQNLKNARIFRYDAKYLSDVFEANELNHVFVHHPDPWLKRRQNNKRLVSLGWLEEMFKLQREGCFLEFKTDSREYFFAAHREFQRSSYVVERYTEDLHQSEWADDNFTTHFEHLFIRQNLPIHYCVIRKKG